MADNKKNIVVLGGAGFVGSHLCDELVKYHHVICVDDFISGEQKNIDHLLRDPNFEFIKHNMVEPLELETLPELERFKLKVYGVAEVYNLACPTSVKDFEKDRIITLETNGWGTRNGLEIARQYKSKFLHFSSSVVYGGRTDDVKVFTEDYWGHVDFLSPRACYDEGRRFAETQVVTYRDVYGLDAKIVRVFRAYGPRMKLFDGQMLPDFITDALENKELVIYGDKTFSTSLVYVSDVVDAAIKLMESEEHGPINIGGVDDYNLYEVAQQIVTMTGSRSSILFKDPLLFMTPLGIPDISRAKDLLGWLPVVSLAEGLRQTIDYTQAEKGMVRN
ncbi:GDP-mannose 4,6-dehydratase [Candidatus Falkowbacteria bacterium]|nr:GDP-mannose 4,6-dehydratase [Candidatus Falkowbacteria bacterium]